ncbi:proline-rich proteoglycan 2-like isoform X7 [Lagopus muta]|uniref:proline-rich proteoglycan 2-like isoform X7 n=1 Tax=Lagopus muta TaxID=64668 RepID=UPI00209E8305|nr:proline-rich proteoglycan 2-like isoform X7 [Lagopus muta]
MSSARWQPTLRPPPTARPWGNAGLSCGMGPHRQSCVLHRWVAPGDGGHMEDPGGDAAEEGGQIAAKEEGGGGDREGNNGWSRTELGLENGAAEAVLAPGGGEEVDGAPKQSEEGDSQLPLEGSPVPEGPLQEPTETPLPQESVPNVLPTPMAAPEVPPTPMAAPEAPPTPAATTEATDPHPQAGHTPTPQGAAAPDPSPTPSPPQRPCHPPPGGRPAPRWQRPGAPGVPPCAGAAGPLRPRRAPPKPQFAIVPPTLQPHPPRSRGPQGELVLRWQHLL